MGIENHLESPLARAVRIAGSQSAFARLIGKSQPLVHEWLKTGKALPAEHVIAIEEATGVSRHDLRPDIYPRDRGMTHVDRAPAGTRHHFATPLERAR